MWAFHRYVYSKFPTIVVLVHIYAYFYWLYIVKNNYKDKSSSQFGPDTRLAPHRLNLLFMYVCDGNERRKKKEKCTFDFWLLIDLILGTNVFDRKIK